MIFFRNPNLPPPGGEYFFERNGESFRTTSYYDAIAKVRAILRRNGDTGSAEGALAEYMCPHLPDGFCNENFGNRLFTLDRQRKEAEKYFRLPVVTFDEIERRLSICASCKEHSRTFCLSCLKVIPWVEQNFRGARKAIPADRYSGTCLCAGTFESVVVSVSADCIPEWSTTPPPNCWRHE